jgi:isoleucyl-tRNA synthetase
VAKQFGLTKTLTINSRALGPRIGKSVQEVIQLAKAGNWELSSEGVRVGTTQLFDGEYEVSLQANSNEGTAAGVTSSGFVLLNLMVTEELEQEGVARDAIRHVQQARKDAGLDVSDRIHLSISTDQVTLTALKKHADVISEETLATELQLEEGQGVLQVGESGLIKIELSKQ